MIKLRNVLALSIFTMGVAICSPAQPAASNKGINLLEIRSMTVDGKPVTLRHGTEAKLEAFPNNIVFDFGMNTNIREAPIRIRTKLEGYENEWKVSNGEMFLDLRFFNAAGDQVSHTMFPVGGESAGWKGSLKTSTLTHRRETAVVPPQASQVWVFISSAGPPATLGVYVVANLVLSKQVSNAPPVVLLQPLFDHAPGVPPSQQQVPGWTRDGNHSSMAKIVDIGQDSQTRAFAIMDEDIASHAEWRNAVSVAPAVSPGDHLVIEWNEMYSIGIGDYHTVRYASLPAGDFRFRLSGVDIMGNPTGAETSLAIIVPQPFWRATWFWCVVLASIAVLAIGSWRYVLWNRMRREVAILKNQQALERERLRIAHDIHDGLGARVTQISMVSSRAQQDQSFPALARAEFDRISKMSRELVAALYETVWAVDPENDNLDELGNYLCQIANQLCDQAQFRSRFYVVDLPRDVQVSSQTRHNISMAVQEAVHNVIKHARATEVTISIEFTDDLLAITVHDDGSGFNPAGGPAGNGLANMKQRLSDIGGSCIIESRPGEGTTIQMSVKIKSSEKTPAKKPARAADRQP
ncbi:MAG TPA: sensor histidine kinase [Candidatus Acidoferrales bacterium]|jgi:signal transduction histidine kinase|nr:sensor histidine kinase [Candidatus Acidoferrales bacterium]